ncbi:hypothetical protein WDW86_16735 [Bdellovibrionota bacterium FG-2]
MKKNLIGFPFLGLALAASVFAGENPMGKAQSLESRVRLERGSQNPLIVDLRSRIEAINEMNGENGKTFIDLDALEKEMSHSGVTVSSG